MKPLSIAALLTAGVGLVTATTSPSSNVLDDIIARGYLRVGTTGDYAPFTHVTKLTNSTTGTDLIGADIDMAESLSSALGLTSPPIFVKTVWANLATNISTGAFDIGMGGISITLARALKAFFSTPVLRVGKVACVPCSRVSEFSSLAAIDRAGIKVATPAGGSNEAFDRANFQTAEIVVYPVNSDIFRALLNETADVVVTDRVEAELWAGLYPDVLCAVHAETPYSFEELGYIMPRDVVWQNFVNEWLRIQQGSGAWNSTMAAWMKYDWGL
ncbi:hypothetical protein DPSP01_013607 [Paraphaeosphaeria sporulosa]|uniref:Cyclohexadienyl dehydratase n=1 Tax=Paraphaeosphaeria sporulosa TaxID=1460663 RepID=A0A177D077_9PLEO|nr:cyclohexadienyl dehydratase [Paraphaeosphaeria sporulosa]OAG13103.1 cyclohexadienyl dehydratase [Paraphaeosphaeria sporulosa]